MSSVRAGVLITTVAMAFVARAGWAETTVKDAWVRASIGNIKVTAGYGVIVNSGPSEDELVSVSTSAATMTHLHVTEVANGVASMKPVKNLAIPGGGSVALEPGGYHLMLINIPKPLKAGETVELIFTFKNQGPIRVAARVVPVTAEQVQ